MEVDKTNFHALLSSILTNVASSRFVSLDLELSGIPRRPMAREKVSSKAASRKQTLQQRYAENKAAAERYHILQLGLTCVEEDEEDGRYILRPYNFQVSPLVDERLKIDRDIIFQNGAVNFLMGHHFQMDAPFERGIPYLSYEEEERARSLAKAGLDRDEFEDISIQATDQENLLLMKQTRQEIAAWGQMTPRPDYLNIAAVDESAGVGRAKGLNRYQKRLIHQLVRAEYPECVSISRSDFIQIIPYDKEREDAQVARKLKGLERNISYQAGLRWIVDAICSSTEHPLSATQRVGHEEILKDCKSIQSQLDVKSRLAPSSQRKTMLVGHNLFLDLIYLYKCFIGPLPDQVEEFQSCLSELFTLTVDTKYVADKLNSNSPHYHSSLEDLDQELSMQVSPVTHIPPEFNKYNEQPRLHEAGYDAFLTARALVRLSSKFVERKPSKMTKPRDVSVIQHFPNDAKVAGFQKDKSIKSEVTGLSDPSEEEAPSTRNLLYALQLEENGSAHPGDDNPLMMPDEQSPFWTQHGNKLRVNGTIEEFCGI